MRAMAAIAIAALMSAGTEPRRRDEQPVRPVSPKSTSNRQALLIEKAARRRARNEDTTHD